MYTNVCGQPLSMIYEKQKKATLFLVKKLRGYQSKIFGVDYVKIQMSKFLMKCPQSSSFVESYDRFLDDLNTC